MATHPVHKQVANTRMLLVPHSGVQYSRAAIEAAADAVPPNMYTKALVISTSHNIENEHSYKWMAEAFASTDLADIVKTARVEYAHGGNISGLIDLVIDKLTRDPSCLIIFNTDLTHYGANYLNTPGETLTYGSAMQVHATLKTRWEQPLLDALRTGVSLSKALNEMPYKPCGASVLKILSRIMQYLNYEGVLLAYYDSIDIDNDLKRSASDSFVSYVAMAFKPHPYKRNTFVGNFCKRYEELETRTEWVFVSLSCNGKSYACVGRTDDTETVCNKMRDLVDRGSIDEDLSRGRLRRMRAGTELFAEVTILDSSERIRIDARDKTALSNITGQNAAGEWYGVRCVFAQGNSPIFIPSVWRSNPSWSMFDVLESLSVKTGMSPDAWREKASYIEIFTELGTFT